MSLTEEWKANKLPKDKKYFIKFSSFNLDGSDSTIGSAYLDQYNEFSYQCGFYDIYIINDYDIEEVLAPCDYEYLQKLNQVIDSQQQTNQAMGKKLRECQEVLKECKDFLYMYPTPEIDHKDLYNKVIDILGEDNE